MRLRNLVKGAALSLGVLALVGANPVPTAQASHPAVAQAACRTDAGTGAAGARTAAGRGRGRDHDEISLRKLHRINLDLSETARRLGVVDPATGKIAPRATGTSSLRLANPLKINVYVHNVYGSHAGERDLGSAAIKAMISNLNRDYSHGEASYAPYTRYRFVLAGIQVVRSDAFYHADPDSSTAHYWHRRLRQGTKRDLNVYLVDMSPYGQNNGLLGYSSFPWDYAQRPGQDGVNVNPESLPGRKLTHYNEGDTATHEVGHWLGLLHPFQNECKTPNDGVNDTAPQAVLNGCPKPAATCLLQSGKSNPGNYMQYTYDSCMVAFTNGQVDRMDLMWARYRQ